MFDIKVINAVISQLEDERGISPSLAKEAIEAALAAAYKKDFGKRGQVIRAHYDRETSATHFEQVKIVVDDTNVRQPGVEPTSDEDERPEYNPETHIELATAKLIKRDAEVGEELVFPLENRTDFGRIAAQTAKQVMLQAIRTAERGAVLDDYSELEGTIVSGTVQRFERGNLYVDLGRATAILPFNEQIKGERFEPGERIRAYLFRVDDEGRANMFLKLSRSHPQFLTELFRQEAPEVANGTVEIKSVAREPGARAKIAVHAIEDYIDPIGSLVGQRGVRVSTVTSELNGERIDIIEWSEDPIDFIEEALSPARVHEIELIESEKRAIITVDEDQLSLAIGRGGQNVRLASRLTGYSLDIQSLQGSESIHDDNTNEPDFTDNDDRSAAEEASESALSEDGSPVVMEEGHAEETEEQSSTDEVVDQSPDTDDYSGEADVDEVDSQAASDEVLVDAESVDEALSETNEEVRKAQEEAFDRDPEAEPIEPKKEK